jgi:hypothetical protein
MTDDRDPFVTDALRRLADAAPQPRADRLVAVAIGALRRHQIRVTAGTIGAFGVVMVAALGVHTWTNTSAQSISRPTHSGSALPSAPVSSPAPASSGPDSSTTGFPGSAPSGPATNHLAESVPVVRVAAPAAGSTGAPVTVTVTVTNKGSATTHGGTVSLTVGFTAGGASQGSSIEFTSYSAGCQAVSSGLLCDVGTLKPGQSTVFSQSITPRGSTNTVTFNATWRYTPPGGAAIITPLRRVVVIAPGIPSSQEPVSSIAPSSVAPSATPSAS